MLDKKQEELEKENRQLRGQVDGLEREIMYLRNLMEEVRRRRSASSFTGTGLCT